MLKSTVERLRSQSIDSGGTRNADVAGRPEELAWIAGFLDGEGFIIASKQHGNLYLLVGANQVEPEALRRISRVTKTKVCGPYQPPSKQKSKPYYVISVGGARAEAFIQLLWPYLTEATKYKYYKAKEKIQKRMISADNPTGER
jgi:hypothetical protein